MQEKPSTIQQVRHLLSLVKAADFSDFDENAALELDSINRISLISELENELEREIDFEAFSPDTFYSIASLVQFIEEIR